MLWRSFSGPTSHQCTTTDMTSHLKIITTEDGSSSLYNAELKETYHSFHGAIRESRHVFIENGLAHWCGLSENMSPSILEVGFGTGLNAILTLDWLAQHNKSAHYDTLEAFPLEMGIVEALNYKALIGTNSALDHFNELHNLPWGQAVDIADRFTFTKFLVELADFIPQKGYDIIYYDAFAPSKQPEMWTIDAIEKVVSSLNDHGVFVTYCARGQLKRDLKALGLMVETLDGPPGKKEMVRAVKA